jgi:hypothetical protein
MTAFVLMLFHSLMRSCNVVNSGVTEDLFLSLVIRRLDEMDAK